MGKVPTFLSSIERNHLSVKSVIFVLQYFKVMEGIMYLTNEHNEKKYVQIDLEKYGEMWSEFYDILIAESRKDDEKIPLEEVKRMLKSNEL